MNKTPVKVLNIKGKEKDKGFVNILIYSYTNEGTFIHLCPDKGLNLKGTVVNRKCLPLTEGSLEITLTVPLMFMGLVECCLYLENAHSPFNVYGAS